MWTVETLRTDDYYVDLDCLSADLGHKAGAIVDSERKLYKYNVVPQSGLDARLAIVTNVAVDRFWRGHRMGPSPVAYAADLLNVDAIFLDLVALHTRVNSRG